MVHMILCDLKASAIRGWFKLVVRIVTALRCWVAIDRKTLEKLARLLSTGTCVIECPSFMIKAHVVNKASVESGAKCYCGRSGLYFEIFLDDASSASSLSEQEVAANPLSVAMLLHVFKLSNIDGL